MKNTNATAAETKTWFITGSSRGFGKIWTEAALRRGDRVVATARNTESIDHLNEEFGEQVLTLELDVTNEGQVQNAVNKGKEHFGQLDIVLNNAGYSLVGTIEESSLDDIKALYDTNVLGTVSVIKAALPILREQSHGHILAVSSGLGHFTLPVIGYYCSSKWALESIHESLAMEVAGFGIKVSIIEPGAYATEFGSQQSLKFAAGMEEYAGLKQDFFGQLQNYEQGDPLATADAIMALVDAENPPLRLFLGKHNLPTIRETYAARLEEWEAWKEVSDAAQGHPKSLASV